MSPDRSILIGQKSGENANIEILGDFQTMRFCGLEISLRIGFLRPRYSWKFFQFCKFASYFNIDSLVWFVLDSSRMNTWVHQSGISYSNEKISSLALSIFFNDVSSSSAGLMSKHQKVETTWLMVTGFDEYPAGTLLALSWQCI